MFAISELLKVGGTVFGALGICLSLGLIFFPKQILKLNNFLNKQIPTDHWRVILEKEFDITNLIMQARIVAGIVTLLLSFILLVIAIKL